MLFVYAKAYLINAQELVLAHKTTFLASKVDEDVCTFCCIQSDELFLLWKFNILLVGGELVQISYFLD